MKILIIESSIKILRITKEHIEKIKSIDKNIEITLIPSANKDKAEKHLKDAEVIAGHLANILSISNAKRLKLIQAFSAGVDKILTPEIRKSSIMITNVSGIHATPIAEHVIGFMLIFTRKFYDTFKNQQEKIWNKNQNLSELRGKTVFVAGLGNIGTEIARLADCFGANVIAIKQNTKNKPEFVSEVYSSSNMEKVLPKADFVILSLPLTSQTHHIFNMNKFKAMKKSAVIINIGRGPLIDEADLIRALEQKLIAGAGLDVTEEEPLPKESKLWEMANVIITPHHSGWSEKYMDRAVDVFCVNLKAFIKGKQLPNLVDKEKGY